MTSDTFLLRSRPGVDFEDTFFQVPEPSFFRIFMSIVASEYRVIPYFSKGLHGTKQPPILWNKTHNGKLEAADFQPLMDTVSIFVF